MIKYLISNDVDMGKKRTKNTSRKTNKKGKTNFKFPVIIAIVAVSSIAFLAMSFTDDSSIDTSKQYGTVDTSLGSPILGSPDAPVTIIEFGDYQCPHCKKWFFDTKPIIVENLIDTGKVNLQFLDIALLGKDSLSASAATYCAEDQEKYWEYHSTLYSNQLGVDNGWANTANLKKYASDLGLDMDLFASCLDSGNYLPRVLKNTDVSRNVGFSGVTAFMIIGPNNQQDLIIGAQPYEVFKDVIEPML